MHFKDGQPVLLEAVQTNPKEIRSIVYALEMGMWRLKGSQVREPKLMNLPDANCELNKVKNKIAQFAEALDEKIVEESIDRKLLDKSCGNLSKEARSRLQQSLNAALRGAGQIGTCLSNENFAKNASGDSKDTAPAALLAAKYKLQALQLGNGKFSSLIKCEKHKDQKSLMTTEEGSKIIYLDPDQVNTSDIRKLGKLIDPSKLEHELLHRAGLKDEKQVSELEKFCKSGGGKASHRLSLSPGNLKSVQQVITDASVTDAANKAADKGSANTADAAKATPKKDQTRTIASEKTNEAPKTANQTAATKTAASIPVEMTVAQSQVPSAPQLSESISNPPPATESGSQQALVRSASESNGVMRLANNMMGALSTQAVAGDTSLASNNSSSSEVSRSAASTSVNKVTSSTKNPAADLLAASARNSVGTNERVVEQITLDGSQAPTTKEPASDSRSRNIASDTAPTAQTSISAASAGRSSEVASASEGSSGGGLTGSSLSSNIGSISGGSNVGAPGPARGPAAVSEATTAPKAADKKLDKSANREGASASAAREEVITFISRSNYSQAKQRLSDPAFGKQLESQKITVLDLYGNSVGASKGEVIFLDQGDRFVRQK
ncbi:hypothetical protein [Bdellovibrio bacteriovorus]|uniref:hypothetical protein n=1 Tax=Bdellovibrio bacteriovorus TaxID=959 RepID=UPI00130D4B90|nr:hypothetical protein [Bdellovibrio bacteriovorus]